MRTVLLATAYTAAQAAATTWVPSALFDSWAEDGTNITVPIASFTNLTVALADGVTGDARQVMLSMCNEMFEYYNDQSSAGTAPEAVTVKYKPKTAQLSGDFANKIPEVYELTFYTDFPERTVCAEPS